MSLILGGVLKKGNSDATRLTKKWFWDCWIFLDGVDRGPNSHSTSGSGKALRASRIMPARPFIVKRFGFFAG